MIVKIKKNKLEKMDEKIILLAIVGNLEAIKKGGITIDESDNIITDICDVCFWQYDEVAQNVPDSIMGTNKVTLNTAKKL